jgi:hypothetical protein
MRSFAVAAWILGAELISPCHPSGRTWHHLTHVAQDNNDHHCRFRVAYRGPLRENPRTSRRRYRPDLEFTHERGRHKEHCQTLSWRFALFAECVARSTDSRPRLNRNLLHSFSCSAVFQSLTSALLLPITKIGGAFWERDLGTLSVAAEQCLITRKRQRSWTILYNACLGAFGKDDVG